MTAILIQRHDATAERPTPTGPFWAIEVTDDDGKVIATDWSLGRWISEPWGPAHLLTPHRGFANVLLSEADLDRFEAALGQRDWDLAGAGAGGRLLAALGELFPDAERRELAPRPAPAWPRTERLSAVPAGSTA